MGNELVEVPKVVSQSKFQQHFVEHTVGIPVLGGVGDRMCGGLQDFFPGQLLISARSHLDLET